MPQAITNHLRETACIATEDNDWVLPAEAVICKTVSTAARQLLAHATSVGVAGAKYVHQGLSAMHHSSALQSALGIKTLDVAHMLQVLHSAHAQGMFPALGVQWCAQMLACIFDMLAVQEPQLLSAHSQTTSYSKAIQSACQQLKALPMFMLTSGVWAAIGANVQQPLFNVNQALVSQTDTIHRSDHADSSVHKLNRTAGQCSLNDALRACHMDLGDMQLRVLATEYGTAGEESSSSLFKMLQASI